MNRLPLAVSAVFLSWALSLLSLPTYAEAPPANTVKQQQMQLWQQARDLRKKQDYQAAIALLQPTVVQWPDWYPGRIELSMAYFQQQEYRLAKQTLLPVLRHTGLSEANQQAIKKLYLNITHQLKKQEIHRWDGHVTAYRGYDSNANAGPTDIYLDLDDLVLADSALATADHYLGLAARVRHRYQPVNKQAIGWQTLLGFHDKSYDDYEKADLRLLTLSTGPTAYVSPRIRWHLPLEIKHVSSAGEYLLSYIGIKPSLQWALDDAHRLSFIPELTKKDYHDESDSRYEGYRYRFAFRHDYKFDKELRLGWLWQWQANRADQNQYRYDALKYGVYFKYEWHPEWTTRVSLNRENIDYKGIETPYYTDARSDEITSTVIHVNYQLHKDWDLGLVAQFRDNSSNHALHQYERQRIELNMRYSF